MASATASAVVFEDYFRRADLDQDGRISGPEAISFFRGANLAQVTLAKIWQLVDPGQTGFLTKPSFFNALKLVTVAQSGRELTPEIVQAALVGPVGAQIPPPRIGSSTVAPQTTSVPVGAPSVSSRPLTGVPPRSWSAQPNGLPVVTAHSGVPPTNPKPGSGPGQRPPTDTWPSIRLSSGVGSTASNRAASSNHSGPPPGRPLVGTMDYSTRPTPASSTASSLGRKDAPSTGNGLRSAPDKLIPTGKGAPKTTTGVAPFTSSSLVDAFMGDPFSASSAPKAVSQGSLEGGFRGGPDSTGRAPTTVQSRDANLMEFKPVGHPHTRSADPVSAPGIVPSPPQGLGPPWPRMMASDIQRYTRVFAEVDTDRDGKISGDQARDLFLSWRLPREVLKQVWDLSDQDGDRMLSMREFCTALYLMERFREGRSLPTILPPGIFAEEQQHHMHNYNLPNGHQNSAALPSAVTGFGPGNRSGPPSAGIYDTVSQSPSVVGDNVVAPQQKSRTPSLEPHLVNQLSRDEQDTLKSRHKDAEQANNKANGLDKEIMDYREKGEFYRTKLQEIILFKSRCENRLGEITERAAADKREMESLAKKYDERFKAAGEANSRLQAEEAAFRDIQERKIELYNAIAKLQQGGDANGLLQSKADRISSDLDELKKALNERARRLGLNVKATAPTEKEFGWQPGLQENAAEWDEEWDKFDDEGFVTMQDFMDGAAGVSSTVTASNTPGASRDKSLLDDGFATSTSPSSLPTMEITKQDTSVSEQSGSDHVAPPFESDGSGESESENRKRDGSKLNSEAVDKSSRDHIVHANKASHRNANSATSEDNVFNDPILNRATSRRLGQGPPSFDSIGDAFDDGHDDEFDAGVRASWGLQSLPPSAKASLDVTSNRTSRFGKVGLSAPQEKVDSSSPGRVTDFLSRTHYGQDSDDEDGFSHFGSSKDYAKSQNLFENASSSHLASGEDDRPFGIAKESTGRSLARFDSFASTQHSPRHSEERRDNSSFGAGKDYTDRSFSRFDSFSSPNRNNQRSGADEEHPDNSFFGAGKEYTDRSFSLFNSFSSGPQSNNQGPVSDEVHRDYSFFGTGKDYTDRSFARFDSLSSPRKSDERQENNYFGAGKYLDDRDSTRFDSFSTAKDEGGRDRDRMFKSFVDKDQLFGGNGTSENKKDIDHGWNGI